MNKTIISNIWKNRKAIAEIATTGFIIGKGIVDFVRKDGIGKVLALGELGLGLGAAAVNTGIADKIISNIADRAADIDAPYAEITPLDKSDDEKAGEDIDEEDLNKAIRECIIPNENYDPDKEDAYDLDEDGFDPREFNNFVNSGESPEYDDEDEETDPEDSEEE